MSARERIVAIVLIVFWTFLVWIEWLRDHRHKISFVDYERYCYEDYERYFSLREDTRVIVSINR